MAALRVLTPPQPEDYLLPGEEIITHVYPKWPARAEAQFLVFGGVVWPFVPLMLDAYLGVLPLLIGLVLIGVGGYRWVDSYVDKLVITNRRVFRVHGLVTHTFAEMPLMRIVDVTMVRTLWGRIGNYGHFRFENAGQRQGLNEVRFVPDPMAFHQLLGTAMTGASSAGTSGTMRV